MVTIKSVGIHRISYICGLSVDNSGEQHIYTGLWIKIPPLWYMVSVGNHQTQLKLQLSFLPVQLFLPFFVNSAGKPTHQFVNSAFFILARLSGFRINPT